jgi:phosphatidylglycerophosphate synthase
VSAYCRLAAVLLFGVAALLDMLDGYAARKLDQ